MRQRAFALIAWAALASGARLSGKSVSVQVQHTADPFDIVRLTAAHRDRLAATHVATQLVRAANMVRQPPQEAARREIASFASCQELFETAGEWCGAPGDGAAAASLLRAAALLGVDGSRVDGLAGIVDAAVDRGELSRGQACEAQWACERLGIATAVAVQREASSEPFRYHAAVFRDVDFDELLDELQPVLRRDRITLDDSQGRRQVEESRLTAWLSCSGTPFKYSGKEMEAAPFAAGGVMERIRTTLRDLPGGVDYDGVLVNYFSHGKVGMRYHVDPDQDVLWTRDTHVLSFGATRDFVLRSAPDASERDVRVDLTVSHGDMVHMFGDCNTGAYQHCVRVEKREENAGPRISLVWKQSIPWASRPGSAKDAS